MMCYGIKETSINGNIEGAAIQESLDPVSEGVIVQKEMSPEVKHLTDLIRQTAYGIHRYLGNGYLEKVYENALKHRLEMAGLCVSQQAELRVHDEDGFLIGFYQTDLIVEQGSLRIIVELKTAKGLTGEHYAQLYNYLKTTGIEHGILINFGTPVFQIKKVILRRTRVES